MKKTLLMLAILSAVSASAMAQNGMPNSFSNTQFEVKNPGMRGYVAPNHKPGPFDKTIFTIKNPGQPGYVKRGGDGGGIGGLGDGNGIR